MNDHQGRVLLVTGVPGSGKTTIMKKVAAALSGKRIHGFVTGEIRCVRHAPQSVRNRTICFQLGVIGVTSIAPDFGWAVSL